MLIDHNADLNVVNHDMGFALLISIAHQNRKIVNLLLQHNPDVNIIGKSLTSPLLLAVQV